MRWGILNPYRDLPEWGKDGANKPVLYQEQGIIVPDPFKFFFFFFFFKWKKNWEKNFKQYIIFINKTSIGTDLVHLAPHLSGDGDGMGWGNSWRGQQCSCSLYFFNNLTSMKYHIWISINLRVFAWAVLFGLHIEIDNIWEWQ